MSVYLAIEVLGIPIRETDTTAQNIGIVGIFPEGKGRPHKRETRDLSALGGRMSPDDNSAGQ
jgi:hypothetical protein